LLLSADGVEIKRKQQQIIFNEFTQLGLLQDIVKA
jgi:hypothetical protein